MEKREDKPVQLVQKSNLEHKSLEVSMLEKDDFSDKSWSPIYQKVKSKQQTRLQYLPKFSSLETVPLPRLEISVLQQVRQKVKRHSTFLQW